MYSYLFPNNLVQYYKSKNGSKIPLLTLPFRDLSYLDFNGTDFKRFIISFNFHTAKMRYILWENYRQQQQTVDQNVGIFSVLFKLFCCVFVRWTVQSILFFQNQWSNFKNITKEDPVPTNSVSPCLCNNAFNHPSTIHPTIYIVLSRQ